MARNVFGVFTPSVGAKHFFEWIIMNGVYLCGWMNAYSQGRSSKGACLQGRNST
jgi:hypothetical protein